MIESTPLIALIGFENYYKIAENVRKMKLIPLEQRQEILERADEELPEEILSKLPRLVYDMTYDREFFKIAEIPYHEGAPEGEDLFTTAVADYLLRERPFERDI